MYNLSVAEFTDVTTKLQDVCQALLLEAALAIPLAEKRKKHSSRVRNRQRRVRPVLQLTADSKCGKGKVVPHPSRDGSQDTDAWTRHAITYALTLFTEDRIKGRVLSVMK